MTVSKKRYRAGTNTTVPLLLIFEFFFIIHKKNLRHGWSELKQRL